MQTCMQTAAMSVRLVRTFTSRPHHGCRVHMQDTARRISIARPETLFAYTSWYFNEGKYRICLDISSKETVLQKRNPRNKIVVHRFL